MGTTLVPNWFFAMVIILTIIEIVLRLGRWLWRMYR